MEIKKVNHYLALVSIYGAKDEELYKASSGTYISLRDFSSIRVIDIKSIQSVVMIAPDKRHGILNNKWEKRFVVMEKPGLSTLARIRQQDEEDD